VTVPPGTPPGVPAPFEQPPSTPAMPPGGVPAAPNAFTPGGPAVAIVQYDPQTGRYAAPDGRVLQQTDLAAGAHKTWQQMMIPGSGP